MPAVVHGRRSTRGPDLTGTGGFSFAGRGFRAWGVARGLSATVKPGGSRAAGFVRAQAPRLRKVWPVPPCLQGDASPASAPPGRTAAAAAANRSRSQYPVQSTSEQPDGRGRHSRRSAWTSVIRSRSPRRAASSPSRPSATSEMSTAITWRPRAAASSALPDGPHARSRTGPSGSGRDNARTASRWGLKEGPVCFPYFAFHLSRSG